MLGKAGRSVALVVAMLVVGLRAYGSTNAALVVTGSEQTGDAGTITIAFDNLSESVSYGPYSTAASIASAFGGKFAKDYGAHVCAHAIGSTILFTLKGEPTFGSVTVTDTGNPSSFQVDQSSWPPSGAINPLVAVPGLHSDPFGFRSHPSHGVQVLSWGHDAVWLYL